MTLSLLDPQRIHPRRSVAPGLSCILVGLVACEPEAPTLLRNVEGLVIESGTTALVGLRELWKANEIIVDGGTLRIAPLGEIDADVTVRGDGARLVGEAGTITGTLRLNGRVQAELGVGMTVEGDVFVQNGASFTATLTTTRLDLEATNAKLVRLEESDILGSVTVHGGTRFEASGNAIRGDLRAQILDTEDALFSLNQGTIEGDLDVERRGGERCLVMPALVYGSCFVKDHPPCLPRVGCGARCSVRDTCIITRDPCEGASCKR